ncbi:MAG: prephenate dehydratase [Chrysothrix sp. TS-e1954]|nr:MAG: prephenate dehydratase [Chrysothrix sp. TS-e1954]
MPTRAHKPPTQAALKTFLPRSKRDPHSTSNVPPRPSIQLTPHDSISSVFESVQSNKARYGTIPVENSTNGPVLETCKCLASAKSKYPHVVIVGEVRLPIRHALLGPRRRQQRQQQQQAQANSNGDGGVAETNAKAPPVFGQDELPDLRWIKRLHTHTQAWSQCSKFLDYLSSLHTSAASASAPAGLTNGTTTTRPLHDSSNDHDPYPKRIDAKSTSSAAAYVGSLPSSMNPNPSAYADAAIASPAAARLHNLPILVSSLEDDHTGNVTRFLLLTSTFPSPTTPSPNPPTLLPPPPLHPHSPHQKCLLTLRLPTGFRPGALSAALSVFASHALNLTNLTSVPSRLRAWDYIWVIEADLGVEDRKDYAGVGAAGEERLRDAVAELEGVGGGEVAVLGVWWFSEEEDRGRDGGA